MKVTSVFSDEWDGLFVNGLLVHSEHTIYVAEGIGAIAAKRGYPIIIESLTIETADQDWIDDMGDYPEKLSDVKLERK